MTRLSGALHARKTKVPGRLANKQISYPGLFQGTVQLLLGAAAAWGLAACTAQAQRQPAEPPPRKTTQLAAATAAPIAAREQTAEPTAVPEPTELPAPSPSPFPSSPPEPALEGAFLLAVQEVKTIPGRGTEVNGQIQRGQVQPGDAVEILGMGSEVWSATVAQIGANFKALESAQAGDSVGLLLPGVSQENIEPGMVVAAPQSIRAHSRFLCNVYVLTEEEGGERKPFFNGYRAQFFIRTVAITGQITLPEEVEAVLPGDSVSLTVELIVPMGLEENTWFALKADGRTIGYGLVTEILE